MPGMSLSSFKWLLPSRLADNPLIWMVQVNGLIVDMWRKVVFHTRQGMSQKIKA